MSASRNPKKRPPVTLDGTPDAETQTKPDAASQPPRVGMLDEVWQWKRQIARVFRAARRGEIPVKDATGLAFIARAGIAACEVEAKLKRDQEELQLARDMRDRLDVIAGKKTAPAALPAPALREHASMPDWAAEPTETLPAAGPEASS